MTNLTPIDVESKIITLRGQQVILDCDVAELYGVETKRINEAVSNNPEKFPEGYVLLLEEQEKNELVEIFDRFEKQKHSTVLPRAFTEKGLYMLATILKSPRAVQTTIAIVEAYAKLKELSLLFQSLQQFLCRAGNGVIRQVFDRDGECMGKEDWKFLAINLIESDKEGLVRQLVFQREHFFCRAVWNMLLGKVLLYVKGC